MKELREAIAEGALGERLWLYSNYHCNLSCSYCLTESSPKSARRPLSPERMIEWSREAAELGFASIGITGGEPFLLPALPDTLAEMAVHLTVLVMTNGTLCNESLLSRMRALSDLPISLQMSLDSAEAATNDRLRAQGNFDKVIEAIAALKAIGLRVRIATTGESEDEIAKEELCALHLRLGIPDADHISRPVVRRGRAAHDGAAVPTSIDNLPAELTLTADGAFYSPFAPTVYQEGVDIDLLICRVTSPLRIPVANMLRLQGARPPGGDATLGIQ